MLIAYTHTITTTTCREIIKICPSTCQKEGTSWKNGHLQLASKIPGTEAKTTSQLAAILHQGPIYCIMGPSGNRLYPT
jgi:hypothetical protein